MNSSGFPDSPLPSTELDAMFQLDSLKVKQDYFTGLDKPRLGDAHHFETSPVREFATSPFTSPSPVSLHFLNDTLGSLATASLLASDVNDAAEILLMMKMATISSPTQSVMSSPYPVSRQSKSRRQSFASDSSRPGSATLQRRRQGPANQYRRRSVPETLSLPVIHDASQLPSSVPEKPQVSPSLKNSTVWEASKYNLDNFELATTSMHPIQRNHLRILIERIGSKIEGLELIYKPPTKRKPDARWIPKYVFQKCLWIDEIWSEWKYGLNGLISLNELDNNWGSEWVLARKDVKHEKFRRMRVIKELRRMMVINNWSEGEMLDWAFNNITSCGINARKWGDSLPKQSTLPADYFNDIMDLDEEEL